MHPGEKSRMVRVILLSRIAGMIAILHRPEVASASKEKRGGRWPGQILAQKPVGPSNSTMDAEERAAYDGSLSRRHLQSRREDVSRAGANAIQRSDWPPDDGGS